MGRGRGKGWEGGRLVPITDKTRFHLHFLNYYIHYEYIYSAEAEKSASHHERFFLKAKPL
jgi:hypothetical protein